MGLVNRPLQPCRPTTSKAATRTSSLISPHPFVPQVLFYCLDTIPILICFAAYIVRHPGPLLPPPLHKVGADDGSEEATPQFKASLV